MKSHLLQDGVILHQFHTLGRILAVLGGDVAACAGLTTCLVLGALQNNLDAIAFCFLACHDSLVSYHFNVLPVYISIGNSLLQCSIQTDFVYHTKTSSANLQLNPATFFYIVEFLAEEVNVKASLGVVL